MVKFNYLLHRVFKLPEETAIWSGLSINLTTQVCLNENVESLEKKEWKSVVLHNSKPSYTVQLPDLVNQLFNLWTFKLKLIDINNIKDINSFGDLVFSSDPKIICSKEEREKYFQMVYLFKIQSCATLQTTVNLNRNILNERKEFEIGIQKFEYANVTFYLKKAMALISKEVKFMYFWILKR